jgi:hypothetical protein
MVRFFKMSHSRDISLNVDSYFFRLPFVASMDGRRTGLSMLTRTEGFLPSKSANQMRKDQSGRQQCFYIFPHRHCFSIVLRLRLHSLQRALIPDSIYFRRLSGGE